MPTGRRVWSTIGRWVRRGVVLVIVVLLLEFVVLPQMSEARSALLSLSHISLPLIALAVGLEVLSLLVLAALGGTVLSPAGRPGYFTLLRIRLADLGVNNVVPGGGITSLAARYRLLTLAGVHPSDVLSSAGIEIAISNLVLGGIFGIGVLFSLSSMQEGAYYPLAGVVILAVFVLAAAGFLLLLRHRNHTLRMVGALGRRFPAMPERSVASFIELTGGHLAAFAEDRRRLAVAIVWASLNWLLDAASLWVFLLAFGYGFDVGQLLLAYGLASILGMLPITPGGLGIVEGILVPALVGFGAAHSIVVLGVVAWRLVEYWLPIPLALLAYASLRFGILRPSNRPLLVSSTAP